AKLAREWGFITADQDVIKAADIQGIYDKIYKDRDLYDFEMDGLVFKIDAAAIQEKVGITEHHPRWMVALKFPAEEASTTVESIDWQVGRTGKITPVANVKPVSLAGATLSRATLHNANFVRENDIAPGDEVFIVRSGDVIPKITGVAIKGKHEHSIPKVCPSCGTSVRDDGVTIWCDNRECVDVQFQKLQYFVKVLKIEHIGGESMKKLWEKGLVRVPADLYKLDKNTLVGMFGKNGGKMFEQIQSRTEVELDTFLASLGIPNLSKVTARSIAERFHTLDKVLAATRDELEQIEKVGKVVSKSIVEGLKGKETFQSLLDAGVTVKPYNVTKVNEQKESPITGMKVYITGSVPGYKKDDLKKLVEAHGGKWAGMSKSLGLLVLGNKVGAVKLEKAKEYGIKTMPAKEFLKLLGVG
ncbi:MAG: helix-hairpin-helix domain-containing protein, partial [Promethearchaeota archaeon]